MKPGQKFRSGKSGFDLLEEATHLLRTGSATTLASYYLGAIPFVLGALFFWADMSRSPFAPQQLAAASFGMTLLFFWMKFWQAIFAQRIRAQAANRDYRSPGFRACARIFVMQAVIQSSGLFLLPLALVPVLPFPWVYVVYQNVTSLDDGEESGVLKLLKKAWRQAGLWSGQKYVALGVMFVFGVCVFLNWASVCLVLPQICKMLFGIESEFTRSPLAMLNTTFFAAMFGLTYLCVDPIMKTACALWCFYGESQVSGEDLKADLKTYATSGFRNAAAVLSLIIVMAATTAGGAPTNAPAAMPPGAGVSPAELDHAISQTIQESKYVWRMPRERVAEPDADEGILVRFFNKAGEIIRKWAKAIIDWVEKMLRKLFPDRSISAGTASSGYGWIMVLQVLLYGLVAAVVIGLAIFLMRVWRGRPRTGAVIASEPIRPAPDITDENVRADQLPEDGWTKLARELLERGEYRLALRAFYLASLAQLAARNLISIARFKSNHEYERELGRRGHAFPALLAVFGDNISVFERIWYGMHEVNGELVMQFAVNVERMRASE